MVRLVPAYRSHSSIWYQTSTPRPLSLRWTTRQIYLFQHLFVLCNFCFGFSAISMDTSEVLNVQPPLQTGVALQTVQMHRTGTLKASCEISGKASTEIMSCVSTSSCPKTSLSNHQSWFCTIFCELLALGTNEGMTMLYKNGRLDVWNEKEVREEYCCSEEIKLKGNVYALPMLLTILFAKRHSAKWISDDNTHRAA